MSAPSLNRRRPLRVLHLPPTFYPAFYFGGPTQSVYSLCNHLASRTDVQLRVLTTDTNGPGWRDRLGAQAVQETQFRGYEVTFARKLLGTDFSPAMMLAMWPWIRWADVVHVTAAYSSPTLPSLLATRALGKPLVWSPRGALQRWAGSSRPRLKRAWEALCDVLLDPARSVLHVTSQAEADESALRIRNARPVVIENGVDAPADVPPRRWRSGGVTRLLFLGRIDPKKGIENLLAALARLERSQFTLRICGGGEASYVRKLEEEAAQLGLGARVSFVGPVEGDRKTAEFLAADACVVPSHTENFAMVVAEALAHGTPVVASRGTPWPQLEARGAGLWVENDPASLASALARLPTAELAAMGSAGRAWMLESFAWPAIAARMLTVYDALAAPRG